MQTRLATTPPYLPRLMRRAGNLRNGRNSRKLYARCIERSFRLVGIHLTPTATAKTLRDEKRKKGETKMEVTFNRKLDKPGSVLATQRRGEGRALEARECGSRLPVPGYTLRYLRRRRGGRFHDYLIKDECSDTLPHATDPSAARFFSERESARACARRQEEERNGPLRINRRN